MLPGSIVICIDPLHFSLIELRKMGNKTPEGTRHYTVREILKCSLGKISIRLEEIINKPKLYNSKNGTTVDECAFLIELFREILSQYNLFTEESEVDREEVLMILEKIDEETEIEIDKQNSDE